MSDDKTRRFKKPISNDDEMKATMKIIYNALKDGGYEKPLPQFIGYIITDDPGYITNHNNARSLMRHIDRYDLLLVLLKDYLDL